MIRIVLIAAVLLCSFSVQAQKKGNRNFFKLYVLNDKKEVMLIKFQGEWEIPGAAYAASSPISVFLDTIGMQHGITIDSKHLAAQITFHHQTRENPVIMLYYTARYKEGTLKTPGWGEEMKWVPLAEAYHMIPYPEMVAIMKKIDESKGTVWGGAITITYDMETKKRTGYQVMEDFYKLN